MSSIPDEIPEKCFIKNAIVQIRREFLDPPRENSSSIIKHAAISRERKKQISSVGHLPAVLQAVQVSRVRAAHSSLFGLSTLELVYLVVLGRTLSNS